MARKRIETDDTLFESKISGCKAKCQCGHTVIMGVNQREKVCYWCGRIIKNNSIEYFKYNLKKAMNK